MTATLPADLIARVDGLGPRAIPTTREQIAAVRAKLMQDGRDHFNASGWIDGSGSPWEPNDREHFARAYAAIAMPLGTPKLRLEEVASGRDALTDPYFVGGVA